MKMMEYFLTYEGQPVGIFEGKDPKEARALYALVTVQYTGLPNPKDVDLIPVEVVRETSDGVTIRRCTDGILLEVTFGHEGTITTIT